MAILAGKEIIKPYIKKSTGYIKSLLSAQHVEMKKGKTLQTSIDEIDTNLETISSQLTPSARTRIGSFAGLGCYCMYNNFICQVTIDGSLDGSPLNAWTRNKIATLPKGCAPSYGTITVDMSGDTLYFEVTSDGNVYVASRDYVSNSKTYWSGTTTYFIVK